MSNYPHPPTFGGQYYPPSAQPQYHHPPPNTAYPVNYQPQYLQQPSQQPPYQQAPPTPQGVQYANTAAFSQNQFQQFFPPQVPPSSHYGYTHYPINNAIQPFSQGQSQAHVTPFPPASLAANANPGYVVPRPVVLGSAPEYDPSHSGAALTVAGRQQKMMGQPQLQTPPGIDGTDEAIRRALANAGTNPAEFPSLQPALGIVDQVRNVEPEMSEYGGIAPQVHDEVPQQIVHATNHSR
jgi:hypothetical protein